MSRPNSEFRSARRKVMVKEASEKRKARRANDRASQRPGKWTWSWQRAVAR